MDALIDAKKNDDAKGAEYTQNDLEKDGGGNALNTHSINKVDNNGYV